MKTKVRIIKSDRNQGYAHLYLQFLTERYVGSDYLNPAFTITYQTGDPDSRVSNCAKNWYAFKYNVESDKIADLKYAFKVASYLEKHIESYEDKDNPQKVLDILGAELYVYDHEYLPVSLNGGAEYKICRQGSWYKSIYANSDQEATDKFIEFVGEKDLSNWTLEFSRHLKLESDNCDIPNF